MDIVAGSVADLDARASQSTAEPRAYADLPERGRKWPVAVRVAVITGSAAALWGLIFLGYKSL